MKNLFKPLALAALAVSLLQGCGAAIVGGAVVGASMVHDRRDSGTVLIDEKIELNTYARITDDPTLAEHSSIAVTSYNRVALLTGQADRPEVKGRIAAITAKVKDVKRVVDEVEVAPRASVQSEGHDTYITSKVKLALFDLNIEGFDPSRVKVVTEKDVVYLMGILSPQEADAVVEKVRYVNGVKRVVKIFEQI